MSRNYNNTNECFFNARATVFDKDCERRGGAPTNTFKAMSRIRHIERREAADKHIQRCEWTTNTLKRREAANNIMFANMKTREAANFLFANKKRREAATLICS